MFKRTLLAAACLSLAMLFAGCVARISTGYRDAAYVERWGPAETQYYNRWIVVTHRPYREYRKLKRSDHDAYWRWRYSHR